MNHSSDVSIVVPAFNEAESLSELTSRIDMVMKTGFDHPRRYEALIVDDGSTDDTSDVLEELIRTNANIRGIRLRRNLGKSMALMAGFGRAEGDLVVILDADLQDRPEDIPALLGKLDEGFDLVSGWRKTRHDGWLRRLGSGLFNRTVRLTSKLDLHDMNSGIKVMRREVIDNIQVYGQFHRYIPLLASNAGFAVTEIPVANDARRYGMSKYPAIRYQGLFDLISIMFTHGHMHSPLHFFAKVAAVFLIPSSLMLAYMITSHLLAIVGIGGEDALLFERPRLTISLVMFVVRTNIFLTGFVCDFFLHHLNRTHLRSTVETVIASEIGEAPVAADP